LEKNGRGREIGDESVVTARKDAFTFLYSRAKAHLLRQSRQGIKMCSSVKSHIPIT